MKILKSCFLLSLLCLCLFVPGISSVPVTDRDEPHYAQTSRQMLEKGDYFRLKFQDEPRHLKPPGIYWLQALSAGLLQEPSSKEIWPYRLPSVLGAWLAVLLTYGFARRQFGEETAFWGAAFLATTQFLAIEAHLSLTDTVLLFSVVLMQGALWKIYAAATQKEAFNSNWAWLFWGAMALGILVKGVSPSFAALTILGLWVADRKITWIKALRVWRGLLLLVTLSLAWLLPISVATHSNFLWDMIYQDIVPKLAGGQQSHGSPPGFFLLSSLVMLWPFSMLLLASLFYGWRQRNQVNIRFLLAWIVPSYLVFELIPTKLPQYLLPIYPALMLLMASAIVSGGYAKFPYPKLLRGFYLLWLLISWVEAAIFVVGLYGLEGKISLIAYLPTVIILLGSSVAVILAWKNKIKALGRTLVLTSFFSLPLIFNWVIPAFEHVWVTEKIRAILLEQGAVLNSQRPLLALGYREPSLVFRLGTHNVILADTLSNKEAYLTRIQQGAEWVLIQQSEQNEFEENLKKHNIVMQPVATISGWPMNVSHQLTLILYRKEGKPLE